MYTKNKDIDIKNAVAKDTEYFHTALQKHTNAAKIFLLFQEIVYGYFTQNGRDFPWRHTSDPYHILVSEMMLQQTKTDRVIKKYAPFISRFKDFTTLANAQFRDIMELWQGLGYNRRALFLQKIARDIVEKFNGVCPLTIEKLQSLPGIGYATSCAIAAFAFNKPVVFLETNIRTTFLHFFFHKKEKIKDSEMFALLEATLDRKNPRLWYYALMDYGALLKKLYGNLSHRSFHYHKQSSFKNSNRQVRGAILKILTKSASLTEEKLFAQLPFDKKMIRHNLTMLEKEKLLQRKTTRIWL